VPVVGRLVLVSDIECWLHWYRLLSTAVQWKYTLILST